MTKLVYDVNFLVFTIIILRRGSSVPIDYCLHPLNRSDCNITPTPVFSYYKPGSRCEIDFWRGCPTLNKFPDQALCSHYCIGKLFKSHTDENTVVPDQVEVLFPKDPCQGELNTTKCSQQDVKVFTFYDNACVEATWHGCETENKFDDEKSCKDACVKDDLQNWQQQLHLMLPEDIKEIDKIIDSVIESEITTTAPETTSELELTTETPFSEVAPTEAPTASEEATSTTEVVTSTMEETTTSTTEEPTTTQTTTTAPPGDADEVITT